VNGTQTSRSYADAYRGSIYYDEKAPLYDYGEQDRRLRGIPIVRVVRR